MTIRSCSRAARTVGRLASLLIAAALVCAHAGVAAAQTGAFSGDLSRLSDQEVEQRFEFIRERLDEGKLKSQVWQYGFTSGWGLGVVIGATQAAGVMGDDDSAAQASGIVTSVKAAGGVARLLLSPNPGRHGSDNLMILPATSLEDRRMRLVAAERLLSDVEERALDRWSWKRHAGNVAINLAGAGVILGVAGFDDGLGPALTSFGVGVTAGTVMAFTMPWRGEQDAEDYRRGFVRGPKNPEVTWSIVPQGAGLALRVDF